MKRIQLDFNVLHGDFLDQAKSQYKMFSECGSLEEIALMIRDELGLKRCTRVLDSFIFTEID